MRVGMVRDVEILDWVVFRLMITSLVLLAALIVGLIIWANGLPIIAWLADPHLPSVSQRYVDAIVNACLRSQSFLSCWLWDGPCTFSPKARRDVCSPHTSGRRKRKSVQSTKSSDRPCLWTFGPRFFYPSPGAAIAPGFFYTAAANSEAATTTQSHRDCRRA